MHHGPSQRRGTIYLMVMATVVIVVTLSLTGIAFVRVQRKAAELSNTAMDARSTAPTGIEYASAWIGSNAAWRQTAATAGGALPVVSVGRNTLTVTLTDPVDGSLTNSVTDPVRVTSAASNGSVTQTYRAQLTPTQVPMSCLSVGTCVGGNINLNGAVAVGSDRLSSNSGITATLARVWLPVQASSAIVGTTFNSTVTPLAPSLQLPDSTAFNYYTTNGTQITSSGMSGRRIENVVLSPLNNPYGNRATNSKGVYWLDCQGDDYTIQNCRIVGTLVLLNCASNTVIGNGVTWAPFTPDMPALMVQGSITFQGSAAPLSESAMGINYNPTGVPYMGVSNSTTTDIYPAIIKGVIYVSGTLSIPGEMTIDGALVVGGTLSVTGMLSVMYNDYSYYNPPNGFRAATVMTLVPGSYEQVVY